MHTIQAPITHKRRAFCFLRILDKMIVQDLLKTLIAVLSVIVIIIVSRKFISILKLAVNGQLAAGTLLHFFSLKIIVVTVSLIPVATFMAILMVLGRMYRDHEMTAMAGAGMGLAGIYRAIFMVVMPVFMLAVGLAMYSAPWAEAQMKELIKKDSETADIRGIAAGQFSEYSHGDLVVYVQGITQSKELTGIFVQDRQHGKLAIVTAESGGIKDLDDGRYIILKQGQRIQGVPGSPEITKESFQEYSVRIESHPAILRIEQESVQSELLWEAGQRIDIAELQRRFAIPLGTLILAFLAVPLAKLTPRGGIYGNILLAALIYFSYENIRKVAQSWIISGKLHLWYGYATVYALLLLAGILLIMRLYGWQWFIRTFKFRTAK